MADDALPDNELDPSGKPEDARAWLAMITHAEKEFKPYQDKADNIDKLYANLEKLSNTARDRQFQMFWANIQVLGPSVYSRPPIPVVTTRFRDRKPIPRAAAELLERATVVNFELEMIDQIMRQVRDDMVVVARGQVWIRYEAAAKDNDFTEAACIEHADRKDFLHGPARTWKEVPWVAKRSWLTKKEIKERFKKAKPEDIDKLAYEQRKADNANDTDDPDPKAGVWEVWHKAMSKVAWVGEGCENCLDLDKPHLSLEGFFPCPKPAYGTVQRRSLIPVPDMVFYKDQLEEINELTARISALTDAVKLRGFYPAGAGELGDAVEAAVKNQADNMVLIPVSNWGLTGGGAPKDTIVWLPLKEVVEAITGLVELRKQLIDDVYQITGLSDIMRGATDARETLGAQELKSQYGSIRVRDRQDELIRFARDITRICAEIMAENFQAKTLLAMSQMDIPSAADLKQQAIPLQQQIAQITAQIQKAQSDPATMQAAQQNPEHAQQVLGQAQQQMRGLQGQLQKLGETVTIEQVMALLKSERIRPFVLDIETDSTIAPDENAQKQRATEFITAVGGFMNQAFPLVQAMPQAAPFTAEALKFVASQYRAGREMQGKIEEFADQMVQLAAQPRPPNPEQMQAQAEAQATTQKMQQEAERHNLDKEAAATKAKLDQEMASADQDRKERELAAGMEEKDRDEARKVEQHRVVLENAAADRAEKAEQHRQSMEKGALEIEKTRVGIESEQKKTEAALETATVDREGKQIDVEGKKVDHQAKKAEVHGKETEAMAAPDHPIIKGLTELVAHLSAPKRIVRDPKTGAAIGVETVRH